MFLGGYKKFTSTCDASSVCLDGGVEWNSGAGLVGSVWGCSFGKIKTFSKCICVKCELSNLTAGLSAFENFQK